MTMAWPSPRLPGCEQSGADQPGRLTGTGVDVKESGVQIVIADRDG